MKAILVVSVAVLISSCASFSRTELGNIAHDKSGLKVVLIPMEDFGVRPLAEIVSRIERAHGFGVSTFTNMGVDETMYNSKRKQYLANAIAGNAVDVLEGYGYSRCDIAAIVLTNRDINNADFLLRYVFASHFDEVCLSVISTARLNPVNYGRPANDILVMERLMKMINKSIGLNYYKYRISANWESVMYGPIMSPQDLDRVGAWY